MTYPHLAQLAGQVGPDDAFRDVNQFTPVWSGWRLPRRVPSSAGEDDVIELAGPPPRTPATARPAAARDPDAGIAACARLLDAGAKLSAADRAGSHTARHLESRLESRLRGNEPGVGSTSARTVEVIAGGTAGTNGQAWQTSAIPVVDRVQRTRSIRGDTASVANSGV